MQDNHSCVDGDWLRWVDGLALLSAQKTERYFGELGLPEGREERGIISAIARGCLELVLYPRITGAEDGVESVSDAESCSAYFEAKEAAFATLPCGFALLTREPAEFLRFGSLAAGVDPNHGLIVSTTSWLLQDFAKEEDCLWDWPRALRDSLAPESPWLEEMRHGGVQDTTVELLATFCSRYFSKRFEIELRFFREHQDAILSGATIWERVLQALLLDGVSNRYPWIYSVECCLRFRMLRAEWREVKRVLSASEVARVEAGVQRVLAHSSRYNSEARPPC